MKKSLRFLLFVLFVTMVVSKSYSQADSVNNMKLLKEITPDLNQKLDELKQQLNTGKFSSAQDVTTKMYDIIYGVESKMYPPEDNAMPQMDSKESNDEGNASGQNESMNIKPKRKSGWKSGMSFLAGFATAIEGNSKPIDRPDINFWRSAHLEYGFNFRKSLNASNSANLNIGLTYMYFDFDTKAQQLAYDDSKDKVKFIKNEDLKDSDFGAGFLSIPVTIDFKLSRKIIMGVGGFGAIRTNSFSSYEIKTSLDERIDATSSARYNMNSILYGGRLYLGTNTISLYVNYAANTLFKDQYDLNPLSFGLRFGF